MGPKKDKVWLEFKIIEGQCDGTGKKKKTVLCKYCNVSYSFPNATRMNGHLAYQCSICPEDIKQRAIDSLKKGSKNKKRKHSESDRSDVIIIDDPQAESDKHSGASSSSNGNQVVSHKHSVMSSQSSIISFVEKTPLEKKKKIDELLARAMYVTSAPLTMFSNPYWQAAFYELRSSYSLPTPYEFGTPLLNAEYSRVMTSASNKLKSAVCLGLMTDGWSNVRAEGIVNFLISTPAIVFIKNVNPGQKRKNSAFISRELIQVIEDCETNYDINPKKFFVLITDNAAVMKAAWCLVLEKFPHICAVACSAHSLNLLLIDIIKQPSLSSFYKQVKSVIKTVKKKTVVLATFQSKQADQGINQGITLKLPPKTRWCYIAICLESLLVNKSALQQTVICEQLKDCIPRDVRSNVLDDEEFWDTVKIVHDFLVPLHTAIKKVEGDTALLSLVPEVTSNVRKSMQDLLPSTPLDHNEQETVQKAITERLYHCNLEVHFAANLLDPRFKGKKLDSFEIHSAMDFISKQCIHLGLDKASLMADLAAYRTGTGFYQREYLWESANSLQPTVWWGGLCASQPLEPLASRLLSIPPTSAGCERDWSIQGSIHTKKRNRLKNERVEKLKAIKQNVQYTANALLPKKVKNLNPNVESASDVSLDEEHRNLNLELPLSESDWSDSDSETSEYTSDD